MYSLLTVNNNLSLVSITVDPTTFLLSVVIFFIFVGIYFSGFSSTAPRIAAASVLRSASSLWRSASGAAAAAVVPSKAVEKPLQELPFRSSQLVLEDQHLVIAGQDLVLARNRHRRDFEEDFDNLPRRRSVPLLPPPASPTTPSRHERSPRSPRRLAAGLRTPVKSNSSPALGSPQRGRNDGRPRGFGTRFRRWVLASSMAETRQRRSEQRLLERPS